MHLRVYGLLLRAYSAEFRADYGSEMASVFEESLRGAKTSGGPMAIARLWALTALDILFSAIPDRLGATGRRRHATQHTSPRGAGRMETLVQDVRYALRGLRRAAGFTTVAGLTTALGIGATATIFSVANAVMLRTLPGVDDAGRLVTVHSTSSDGSSFHAFSFANYQDLRDSESGLSDLAAFALRPVGLSGTEAAELTAGLLVSANYFEALGTRPAVGRFFTTEEDLVLGAHAVVVLSHRGWTRRFDSDPDIIGRTISLNGHPFTVVGIAEPEFAGHLAVLDLEVFVPLAATSLVQAVGDEFTNRNSDWLELVGRLESGVTVGQAQAALSAVAARLSSSYPSANEGQGVDVRPYSNLVAQQAGAVGGFFTLLFVVAAMILVVAAVNVAGMLLARASDRESEMAIRLALGAGRRRLIRQMVTESTLLFLLGGAGGIAIAYVATAALSAIQLPIPVPVIFDFTPDRRVLAFSLAIALLTGLGFGVTPALHATGKRLASRINRGRGVGAGGRTRLRETFVVVQVAGSVLLLVGAGLFVRALGRAGSIDLGFDPQNVHLVGLDVGVQQYPEARGQAFFERLVEQTQALPGVESVGLVRMPPLAFGNATTVVEVSDAPGERGDGRYQTDLNQVTPGYFSALRIPLVSGSLFVEGERNVALINETLARRIWGDRDPIGRTFVPGLDANEAEVRVVGVVGDGKYRSLSDGPRAMIYLPFSDFYSASMSLVARTSGEQPLIAGAMRDVVRAADDELPLMTNAPLEEVIGLSFLPNRIAAITAGTFGALGLLLAAIGLYGVLAYTASRRTREVGIRLALGAPRGSVRRLIVGGGIRLTAIGLAIGFVLAAVLARFLGSLLHGISPTDPPTFAAIALLLTATTLLACVGPARRATRTDPMQALRHD